MVEFAIWTELRNSTGSLTYVLSVVTGPKKKRGARITSRACEEELEALRDKLLLSGETDVKKLKEMCQKKSKASFSIYSIEAIISSIS